LHCKKVNFEDIFANSSIISLTGGHTGPPLQRRENLLNKDVGEHLCVLPHNNSGDTFLSIIAKIWFFEQEGQFFLPIKCILSSNISGEEMG